MRVKICGITNLDDALMAVEAGADALGFVFYEKSPRYVTLSQAADIARELPPFVERVGLFVNKTAMEVDLACAEAKMSLAQIHFDAEERFFEALHTKALPVVRAKSKEDVARFSPRYRLVDAFCESYGGAGKRLALEWFEEADVARIVIAGGLDPDNVYEVAKMGFYGVDVSSGVERAKGRKDPVKVREFIAAAKEGACAAS
ncbi:phosphoribosylanthranilate isomerase [Hydrogenimonas sp.]